MMRQGKRKHDDAHRPLGGNCKRANRSTGRPMNWGGAELVERVAAEAAVVGEGVHAEVHHPRTRLPHRVRVALLDESCDQRDHALHALGSAGHEGRVLLGFDGELEAGLCHAESIDQQMKRLLRNQPADSQNIAAGFQPQCIQRRRAVTHQRIGR